MGGGIVEGVGTIRLLVRWIGCLMGLVRTGWWYDGVKVSHFVLLVETLLVDVQIWSITYNEYIVSLAGNGVFQ
jgi:hypothetical protein